MGIYSRYIFPWVLDWAMSRVPLREPRAIVLAEVKHDVLEIGFGTGLNLPYYPADVERLAVADANPGMQRLARRRVAAFRMPVDRVGLVDGKRIDVPDESFDFVISTWTLCSVDDAPDVLSEVDRV